jgi:putative transposase
MRIVETLAPRVGVEPVLRQLGVASSTYYARRARTPSARELRDAELVAEIHAARSGYRGVYGAKKTWHELRRRGVDVGRDRVARLMRREGLAGLRRGRRFRTTIPDASAVERARDLVGRAFVARRPNRLWVADLTYVKTWADKVYLAFILDVYSRMVVGWQIATHMRSELVVDALEMAAGLRRPVPGGLVAHTDRGSQYTSVHYTDRLDELGIAPSVGSRGDAYDNAMAEAFVALYKAELVQGRRFPSFEQAEHETLNWIGFYNNERLHEELDYMTPSEYEQRPYGPPEPDQPAIRRSAGRPRARTDHAR